MDVFTPEKRSWVMSRIRSCNTQPEITVRKLLSAAGFRYRLNVKSLPGKPDVVLRRFKTCIQVHGCFWHGHNCRIAHLPSTRKGFWTPKILGNKARDLRNNRRLRAEGWKLFTIWECECRSLEKRQRKMQAILQYLENLREKDLN